MFAVNKDRVFWRKIDNQTVLVNTETGASYVLEDSAKLLWQNLADGKSQEALALILSETYGLDFQTAFQDVEDFLAELKKEGFIG